jgi:hypothetical protein
VTEAGQAARERAAADPVGSPEAHVLATTKPIVTRLGIG